MKEKKSQQIRMRPSKDCVLYSACCGFAAGVLWRSFWHVSPLTSIIIGATYLLLTLLSQLILKNNWNICISVFVISLIIGIARFQIADIQPPQSLEKEADKTASFTALIVDEPAKSQDKVKLIVEASLATTSTKGRPGFVTAQTGMVIFSKEDQGFQYGDQIKVTGKLEKPANFMTDQDMEFDYVNYLRKDGIFYTMHDPKIAIISRGHGNPVKRSLFSIKSRFDAALSKAVPTPESTVLGGIILGERYGFSESLRQIFMDTGTIHIVTIGGYHVTLVAKWIMAIFGFLPRFAGIGAGVAGIFLYVIATGGAQTSIRAGIMATLALIAGATRRRYDVGRALILAATVMIIINPFVLAYDVSFELSFIATIAIIFLSPLIMPYFEWIPWKWLRDIVAITSSMYVFALPFVLYRIGNLSLVSLPANILIVPLMPFSMIAGFVTGFAGMVAPAFAILPGKIAYALLYFQISSVGTLARLPFAAVTIPGFSLVIIIAVYSIFVWIFIKTKVKGETTNDTPHNHVDLVGRPNIRLLTLISPLIVTFSAAGFLYYSSYRSNQSAKAHIQDLLNAAASTTKAAGMFVPDERIASTSCKINGAYPDHACTPGAVFADATAEDVCIKGYTATVRNVSEKTKERVFEEYGIAHPQPAGAYEIDHFIPLALGGANDIANLFPEAAAPTPGFHEKDVVEVFLQGEVCSGRAALGAAQKQISTDWLAVYNNIPFADKQKIKEKYGGSAVQ